jgi:CDP-glucose 4,6-dehydratase
MADGQSPMDATAGEARILEWGNRRVLVTGGAGFIGSALVGRLLNLGAEVWVPTFDEELGEPHPRLTEIYCDLRDRERVHAVLAEAEPDVVFHLAAVTQVTEAARMPIYAFDVNAVGTLNLLEAIRTMGMRPRIVIASSDKALGDIDLEIVASEPLVMRPSHPYDMTKAAADLIALSYADFYGLEVQSVRTANVYGPGDMHLRRIIPGTMWSVLNGHRPVLRSDGTPVREYLYVTDAVEVYLRAAESSAGAWRAVLCPGDRIAVLPLVRMILELCGSDLEPMIAAEGFHETQEIRIDPLALEASVGDLKRVALADGLGRTLRWMRAWKQVSEEDADAWNAGAYDDRPDR